MNFTDFGLPYQVYKNGMLSGTSPAWNYTTFNPATHYIQNLTSISEQPGLVATGWFRLVDTNLVRIGTNWITVGWNPSADGNKVGPAGASRVDNFKLQGINFNP
jgi:hypothetical protein